LSRHVRADAARDADKCCLRVWAVAGGQADGWGGAAVSAKGCPRGDGCALGLRPGGTRYASTQVVAPAHQPHTHTAICHRQAGPRGGPRAEDEALAVALREAAERDRVTLALPVAVAVAVVAQEHRELVDVHVVRSAEAS
jgi:hypothetical protein